MTTFNSTGANPAIIRGDLNDEELCHWLYMVDSAIKAIPSLLEKIEKAKQDIALYEKAISKHKAFISAAFYPTAHHPNPPSLTEDISGSSQA